MRVVKYFKKLHGFQIVKAIIDYISEQNYLQKRCEMEIKWITLNSKKYLKFSFDENLGEQEAISSIEKWKKEITSNSDTKVSMIWDCLKMKSYDSKARILWQDALKELKNSIENIWLISNSQFIRVGANVISVFSGLKINPVDSESKII